MLVSRVESGYHFVVRTCSRQRLILCGLVAVSTARIAEAEPGDAVLELVWNAPAPCADVAAVRGKVENQLGYALEARVGSELLTANAVVVRGDGGRFRLQLHTQFRDEARSRELEGGSCEAVENATALMLAFLLDPEAAATRSTPPDEGVPDSEGVSPLALTEPDAAEPPASAHPLALAAAAKTELMSATPKDVVLPHPKSTKPAELPWFLGALAGVDSGALPAATSSIELFFGRRLGPVQLEASALRLSPRERRLPNDSTRGGRFELWGLAADGCYSASWAKLELGPCTGVETGTVFGSGFGVDLPGQGKGLWLAARGMLRATYRVFPRLGTRLQAGVALPLSRPTYVLDNVGTVYRANFIALRGGLALEAYF